MAINKIVCPTKGSKGCKIAEDKAIELAKENNSKLVFLYVIDTRFMERGFGGEGSVSDAASAIGHIGEVILDIAKEKAIERGLQDENILTEKRTGDVTQQINNSVEEHNADLVIIGHPETELGFLERHLIEKEGTESFVKHLKEKIGCEIMLV